MQELTVRKLYYKLCKSQAINLELTSVSHYRKSKTYILRPTWISKYNLTLI